MRKDSLLQNPIQQSSIFIQYMKYVLQVSRQYFGDFSCSAKNQMGTNSASVTVSGKLRLIKWFDWYKERSTLELILELVKAFDVTLLILFRLSR